MSDSEESNCDEPKQEVEEKEIEEKEDKSFSELGINEQLCDACMRLGWTKPTPIQQKCLENALKDRDLIALAEQDGSVRSSHSASFDGNPQKLFALVLTPTRELAFQITEQFEALGSCVGLIVSTIVGGIDMATQTISLAKRPHVIVATLEDWWITWRTLVVSI
uniref:RNA helicase n=1 Tax=Ditylenchus dipsaci TaxID=166011 RepID=A0A915E197_9BILA